MAYSNEVKMNLLHVSPETLEVYGAVSEQTVIEMVKGAMKAAENRLRCRNFRNCRSRRWNTGETGRHCLDRCWL